MKKLRILALVIICLVVAFIASPIRVAQGEVTSRTHIENPYYVNSWLTTTDGESWIAEGYEAPIGDKVLIIYNKCDRSTLYDDEIIYIMHFTKF